MILIDKWEREALDRVGLLRYRRVGRNSQDQNFQVVNKEHCGRNKRTYVAEEAEIMAFLGHYENLNLQKINNNQYQQLVAGGLLTAENSQKWRTYVPNAIAYEDKEGQWRIKKVTKLMLFLGIWKSNKAGQTYQKKD